MTDTPSLRDAILARIREEHPEAAMVTHFVVVAAATGTDGSETIHRLTPPGGMSLWMQRGLLSWESDAVGAQPDWTMNGDLEDE